MTSSGSIHSPLPPLSLSTTSLDPLTSFSSSQHRSSVIEKSFLMKEEEEASWKLEKEQSSEEEGATSSKRRYWPNQIPAASPLSSLPHGVKIKVELDLEEPEEVTEESLLQKYIHKKFSKAKTFSSDLAIAELENRKRRRSVIVHNTPAQTKMRHLDLRMFSQESQWKISPHHLRQSSGLAIKEASEEEEFDDGEERGLMMADEDDVCRPVDLSRCLPSMSSSPWDTSSSPSCSSPR